MFLVSAGIGGAEESIPAPDAKALQQAYEQLAATRLFAFGGIGFAGTMSQGERSFRTVAASTNALALFEALLKKGSAESQLYGLCGIRKMAPLQFEDHARTIMIANPLVTTMAGCLGVEERASNVVSRIATGYYDSYISNPRVR